MSDEPFAELTGNNRDWRTHVPWVGRPEVKTYFDWTHYVWRTEVCILVGVRAEPPGTPWGERRENRGLGRAPDRERNYRSHVEQRSATISESRRKGQNAKGKPDSLRARVRAYLAETPSATTAEIVTALGEEVRRRTIAAIIHNDPAIERVGGTPGGGRKVDAEQTRWGLKEVGDAG